MYLVLGAGGFVGRQLVAALASHGEQVRGLVRGEASAKRVKEAGGTPVLGDLLEPGTLATAFEGARVVFYLVHSMRSGDGYAERDAAAVSNAVHQAEESGVERLVHLGGLCASADSPSRHLRSRHEVEMRIRRSAIPSIIFHASIVIGRGGASFKVMCDVVRNMPIIPMLDWRSVHTQPIAISDVVAYLVAAAALPGAECAAFDIGAPDTATYEDMLRIIQDVTGARRLGVPVPGFWPRSSELALRVITTVPNQVVRELIPGLRLETVCGDRSTSTDVFDVRPLPIRVAIADALRQEG